MLRRTLIYFDSKILQSKEKFTTILYKMIYLFNNYLLKRYFMNSEYHFGSLSCLKLNSNKS